MNTAKITSSKQLPKIAQKISEKIGKAIGDYGMIDEGDKILVAVSGGKDSLSLLRLLSVRRNWAPVRYEIVAVHIKPDFMCGSFVPADELETIFKDWGIEYSFDEIKVLDEEEKTNCFWCSWNRRKALFHLAEKLGCNKIALGHHKDDIVETTLINLIFKGEVSSMNPKQEMFGGKINIIRPLCYVEEDATDAYARELGLASDARPCPFGEDSQRKFMKEFIKDIKAKVPNMDIKTNILKSMERIKEEYINVKSEADYTDESTDYTDAG